MKKFSGFILILAFFSYLTYLLNSPAFAKISANKDAEVAVGKKIQFIRNIYALHKRGETGAQKGLPKGIAIDKENRLFAIFLDLFEVQAFNSNGEFLYRFGKKGVEEGEFWVPLSIEIADNGMVFILDGHLHKILAFSNKGEFQYEFSFRKRRLPEDKELMRCTKMGLDRRNNILYLSDCANYNIKLFTLKGDFLGLFPWDNKKAGTLAGSSRISFDDEGKIYIPDFLNGEVHVYDAKKKYLFSLGGLGDRLGNLSRPIAVSVNQEGNIYVLDRVISAIQVFNPQGRVLGVIKDTEVSKGLRFTKPFDMVMNDSGVIYISSQGQHCIKVFQELTN